MYSDGQHELLRHRRQFRRLSRVIGVNKFGRLATGPSDPITDPLGGLVWRTLWDDGNSVGGPGFGDAGDNFRLPNSAVTHTFYALSDGDSAAGIGAQSLKVFGLTDWDSPEISEVLPLNGRSGAATANNYHVINRAYINAFGSLGRMAGTEIYGIMPDTRNSARMFNNLHQTEQAFYGVPSTQTAFITNVYGSQYFFTGAVESFAQFRIMVLENPDTDPVQAGTIIWRRGHLTMGDNPWQEQFAVPIRVPGPALIHMQVSNASGVDTTGGFDLYLVDN